MHTIIHEHKKSESALNNQEVKMEDRKVFMNQHTNLLELEEYMYPLVDVETPNVFRNLFRYDEIPKIAFNDRIVPHHMPEEIWITYIQRLERILHGRLHMALYGRLLSWSAHGRQAGI